MNGTRRFVGGRAGTRRSWRSFAGAAGGLVAGPGRQRRGHARGGARDYVLQCAGCHRVDGRGSTRHGIPDFRDSVGHFTRLPAGREYLIRVPGAAQSQLSDADLAAVLNWVLASFSAAQLPADFQPYTQAEVAAARRVATTTWCRCGTRWGGNWRSADSSCPSIPMAAIGSPERTRFGIGRQRDSFHRRQTIGVVTDTRGDLGC